MSKSTNCVISAAVVAACLLTIGADALADTYAYKVQYLESTPNGGQYIDTGVVPTYNTGFNGTYEYMAYGNGEKSNYDMIAGLQGVDGGRYYPVSLNHGSDKSDTAFLKAERYVLAGTSESKSHATLTRHTIVFNDAAHKVTVDDVLVTTFSTTFPQQTKTCFLFAASKADGAPDFHAAARIYSCEFVDYSGATPTKLRKFIPVIDMDGRPAMFDEENKKLYHNANTSGVDFKAGPAVESWNSAPYFVEYLESYGNVDANIPWIDTGHTVTVNTQTRMGYRFTEESQVSYAILCGVTGLKYYPVSADGASALKERYCYGSTTGNELYARYSTLQSHELIFNKDKNVFVDGKWMGSYNQTFNNSTYPMYVFAASKNDSGDAGFWARALVKHLDIYEGNEIKKAFMPAVDANGVAGLYDRLAASDPFHYNKGEKYADDGTTERYPFRYGRIISHAVALDLSSKADFTVGMNVLPFVKRPSYGTVFTLDETTAASYDAAVRADGVWLVEKDPSAASTAVWTGGGMAGDVADAANWECRNAAGGKLDGVVPSERTVIEVTGSTSIPLAAGSMPNCASIVLSGTVTLTADCDWRGLGTLVIPNGVTIDLNGHNLRLAGFATLGGETATITDSTDGKGELHVEVAENDVLMNDSVAFTGSLRFVKEGAGAFVAQRHNQTYAGGTKVAGGILRRGDQNLDYYNGNILDVGELTSEFEISEGATYDINGAYTTDFIYTLDGGTITNCRPNDAEYNRYVGATVNLTKSSTVTGQNFGFQCKGYGPITVNMNGNALTVRMDAGHEFWLNNVTFADEGTIDVACGYIRTLPYTNDGHAWSSIGSGLTLNVSSAGGLYLESPLTVKNFNSASKNYNKGSSTVTVLGTFKPSGDGLAVFPNIVLADGATIDISDLNATLALGGKIAFADDARTIKVKLGSRKPAQKSQIVSWTNTPANLAKVGFVRAEDGSHLSRREDGIYCPGGLIIMFR